MKLLKAAALCFGVLTSSPSFAQEPETSTGGGPFPARENPVVEDNSLEVRLEQCEKNENVTNCLTRWWEVAKQDQEPILVAFEAAGQNLFALVPVDGNAVIFQPEEANPPSRAPKIAPGI